MKHKLTLLSLALAAPLFPASAAIITVNTVNNISPGVGETSLVQAINQLQDGDTIRFNIPGAGPHYLITPPMVQGGGGGYPEITKNNVTIDGYSQPGATANSNTILAPNNAKIKIVIDSRAGGAHVWNISGYGTSESGMFVVSGNNVTIKGLSFLGIYGEDSDTSPKRYGVALGNRGGNGFHLSGCWLGVDPDGSTVSSFADGVTGFRHSTPTAVLVDNSVIGVAVGSANPRAEFNVIVGQAIPIIIEGGATRISGNFIGVLPDGMHRVPNPKTPNFKWEGHIELARNAYNIVIGTDGDGVNDAEERNLLSGGLAAMFSGQTTEGTYSQIIEFYSGASRTNTIIAGNYIGVAIDGITTFTNSTQVKNGWGNTAVTQFGSNEDGVSDDLEGNLVSMNHPWDIFFTDPTTLVPSAFMGLDNGERISFRGNKLINNNLAPYSYADRIGGKIAGYVAFMGNYMNTSVGAPFEIYGGTNPIPVLDSNSTSTSLKGFAPPGIGAYTSLFYDVYLLDQEGWTNGSSFQMYELYYLDGATVSFYGFPQGRSLVGTFKDNGPLDADPAVAKFQLNLAGLGLTAGTAVTVAANYTDATTAPKATIAKSGGNVVISWPDNGAAYALQQSAALPASWTVVNPQPAVTVSGGIAQMTVPAGSAKSFYRLSQKLKVQTGDFSMPVTLK